jgi:hypothetical protein
MEPGQASPVPANIPPADRFASARRRPAQYIALGQIAEDVATLRERLAGSKS